MSDPTPTAERREQLLGIVAEKTVALLCEVQQRAFEAQTAADTALLCDTLTKLARSARQSVALHGKLEKDRLRGESEAAGARVETRAAAVKARRLDLQRGVEDVLCAHWDPEIREDNGESEELLGALRERLDDISEEENFLDLDPDLIIDQLCQELAEETVRANRVLAPHRFGASTAPPKPGPTPGARANGQDPDPPPADTS